MNTGNFVFTDSMCLSTCESKIRTITVTCHLCPVIDHEQSLPRRFALRTITCLGATNPTLKIDANSDVVYVNLFFFFAT